MKKDKEWKQNNFFYKTVSFFKEDQNCHSDCTYDGMKRNTCCII